MRNISSIFCVLFFSVFANAQDGVVDVTFGSAGFTTILPPSGSVAQDINKTVVLSDGSILQCFSVFNSSTGDQDFGLAKFDMDGNLDPTFDGDAGNGNGIVLTDFGGDDWATALTVQADGKIIVVGHRDQGGTRVIAIARYNPDGTLDTSFDGDTGTGNGKFITSINSFASAYSVAQNGSRIVVGGSTFNGFSQTFAVVVYNISNGVRDNSFDSDGIVMTNMGGMAESIHAIKIQTDGKIVAAGYSFDGFTQVFAIARYNTNGSLDNSFDSDGRVTTVVGDSGSDAAYDLVIHNQSGKILVVGTATMAATGPDFAMVLYGPNGALDTYLGGDGIVTFDLMGSADFAHSVLLQTNFDILIAGYAFNGVDNDFAIAKFHPDGTLNTSFNSAASAPSFPGVNIIDFTGDDYGYGIDFQNANIIFGGINGIGIALTRLTNTGQALPVTLFNFTAAKRNTAVALQWETSNEKNSGHFEIERSGDGRNFTKIAQVPAAQFSDNVVRYTHNDLNPLPSVNFYRLKMVDLDGRYTYSQIVSVKFDSKQAITVFPNPVKDIMNIQIADMKGMASVQMTDASGRMVKSLNLYGNGSLVSFAIDVSNLPKGIYFIKANDQVIRILKD